ncbi:MAG: methyltransferase domain-containing protein [bacterium]|uniref:Arsenite methyltransferase n=2 Tax=Bacteria candidate phyla TaxID=1783234 RepID=A0A101I437_UNCT6|nr:MAG: Methyltransferase type 11 [candidate division TA06 bacterium 32_111]KUK88174.1 MAG: Methyltransferase type 11 [candidate division TA06 bacterium 34_109]MDI6700975.1 methyltransferase domain-containing protein [bacterium]HAF07104.1 methyltransferase type 11 [candidate division WOR-3 bacterium]HCP17149.1 methyltransferase type 11 [candidate division WOR-3 bacterium]
MSNEFERKHRHSGSGHFRGHFSSLFDSEKALRAIGLKRGDTLLDAGCGEGRFSIPALEIVGDRGKVYAVDISEKSIKILKENIKKSDIKNIEAFAGDITKNLPIKNESIDICLMANVLHGLVANKEVESALKEMYRVLKPNGSLVIIDFKKIDGPPGPSKSIRLTPEEVEEIIGKYGFKKKKVSEIGEYHYAITFVKKLSREG